MKTRPSTLVACAACLVSLCAQAEVKAEDAWVRATVPAQKSTGAFMTFTSGADAKIVAASSPAAKIVEIHETTSKDGVMQMRALRELALPAGKPVELKPGGKHVMLLGLGRQVAVGDTVPIVFTVEERGGRRSTLEVRAQARPLAAR